MINISNICKYCGGTINPDLQCSNVTCKSFEFSLGNRVILFNRPDYGSGFIDKILDYKTPFEFCSDKMESDENVSAKNLTDGTLFYEKPMYRVKFKLYFEQIVSAEDLRHEIFIEEQEVKTKFGVGSVKSIIILQKKKKITYDIVLEDNSVRNIQENEIIEPVLDPIKSLLNFQLAAPSSFLLKIYARNLHNIYTSNTIKFISNSRLSLMPHQVFIAHELIMKYLPRYILADEVGLGKTIEAGIFVREMISREIAKKILIVVPASLVEQWIFEFKNKFSIDLVKFDSKLAKNLDRCDHPHIFYRTDLHKECPYVITSLQLARLDHYREILTSLYWDIVIFDEAHHLRRHISGTGKYTPTLAYKLAKKLGEKSRSMLLLTATPIQLHSVDLFNLLQIIRPDVFKNFADFEEERKNIPTIKVLIKNLRNFHNLNVFQKENIIDLIHNILRKPSLIDFSVDSFYDSIIQQSISLEDDKDEINISQLERLETSVEISDVTPIYIPNFDNEQKNYLQTIIESNLMKDNRKKGISYRSIQNSVNTLKGREKLITILNSYHFLSHFMFRNRKRMIFPDNFVKRIVNNVEVTLTEEEFNLYNEIRLYLAKTYNQALDSKNTALGFVMVILQQLLSSSTAALISSLEKRISKIKDEVNKKKKQLRKKIDFTDLDVDEDFIETQILDMEQYLKPEAIESKESRQIQITNKHLQILEEFLTRLKDLNHDSKKDALIDILLNIREKIHTFGGVKKIIIFTQFKKTLFYLKEELIKRGFIVEEFHGDLSREEKEQVVERFKDKSEILLSTEVGGEGRNFQFCNIIINYDIPWNPMRLEQRIGRLDRIGQKNDVFIFNFTTLGTIESKILEILGKRIHLFEESIGNLEPIISNIEKNINKAIFSSNLGESIHSFEEDVIDARNKMEVVKSQLDDFVMDKKSFQFDKVESIVEESLKVVSEHDIKEFVTKFVRNYLKNSYIIEKTYSNKKIPYYEIKLSDAIKNKFKMETNIFKGVFNLKIAQEMEQLEFFALGHPLINSIIDFCRDLNFGNNASILKIDLRKLREGYNNILNNDEKIKLEKIENKETSLFMIIYESEYSGVVLERKLNQIILTSDGYIFENLSGKMLEYEKLSQIIDPIKSELNPQLMEKINTFSLSLLGKLSKVAKKFNNEFLISDRSDISKINTEMFEKELHRLLTFHEYKSRYLLHNIESNKKRIEYLEGRKPTKRQWMNLEKIENLELRKEREDRFKSIESELQSLHFEIDEISDQLEELEFDLPADIKRLEFYKKLIRRTWLSQIAILIPK